MDCPDWPLASVILKPSGMARPPRISLGEQRLMLILSGSWICFCRKFEKTVPTESDQRQSGGSDDSLMNPIHVLSAGAVLMGSLIGSHAALAQSEGWLLGPGSKTGKESTIEPTNCVTSPDGSITCDTKVVNPASDTPARPYYNPFND